MTSGELETIENACHSIVLLYWL